jgi:hypothetical protein
MAGDWIKMRTDLADDPAVIAIAAALELSEDTVVGKLHRLWSWADRHTTDGNAGSVTYMWIDRYISVTGFAEALEEVGWLLNDGATISFPNFDRHNGQSAKARALTMKRVRNARGVTEALPEKRREDKSKRERVRTRTPCAVPTIEEVREYVRELKYTMDPDKFWHHFEANGWRTKTGPLRSWKSAVVNWQKNEGSFTRDGKPAAPPAEKPWHALPAVKFAAMEQAGAFAETHRSPSNAEIIFGTTKRGERYKCLIYPLPTGATNG